MKLLKLLQALSEYKITHEVNGSTDITVNGIFDDSRKVKDGGLFVAISGMHFDAHKFIPVAVNMGAKVVVGEENIKPKGFTYVRVKNPRKALSILAAAWYDFPGRSISALGVTGTKGKTTVSYILYHILNVAGSKVGLISSIAAKINGKDYDTGFHVTNPEPLLLQKFLRKIVDSGCKYAVIEVTSHGLDQDRVFGINFDMGILTNIAPEHLDYHKTYLKYKEAKLKLFRSSKKCILNKDDESFPFITKKLKKDIKVISYGSKHNSDYLFENIKSDGVTDFELEHNLQKINLSINLEGEYNVMNAVASVVAVRELGVSWIKIKKALGSIPQIPGRLDKVVNKKGLNIYIDFAHTPDSLAAVLRHLRHKYKGRLIAVFGCASERDVSKRPKMGKISTEIADVSIFTAEDPRYEDINKILKEIETGTSTNKVEFVGHKVYTNGLYPNKNIYFKIPERGEAITFAIQKVARKGDTVVVCGKGVEKSMAYNGNEFPWSDRKAINYALNRKILKIKR